MKSISSLRERLKPILNPEPSLFPCRVSLSFICTSTRSQSETLDRFEYRKYEILNSPFQVYVQIEFTEI